MPGENRSRTRLIPIGVSALALTAATTLSLWPNASNEVITPSDAAQEEAAEDVLAEAATNPEVTVDAPPATVATERAPIPETMAPATREASKPAAVRPPVASATEKSAAAPESGTVLVTVPGSWGDIYIDGELRGRMGSVRDLKVGAGTHRLVIRNDHALPYEQSFTVAPGENKIIEVTDLQRKPVRVRLQNAPSLECTVAVDSVSRGTVGSLAQTIRVREPDRAHALTLDCPDGTTVSRTLAPTAPGALVTLDLSAP